MVDHIFNGEQGVKVREKLNEVIDRTNALMGIEGHVGTGGNPHGTTAAQVTQSNSDLGPNVQTALDKLDQRQSSDNSNSSSHANNKNNPHEVNAEQVPQSNADLGDNVQEALDDLHGSVVELVEMLPEKADLDHIDGMDTHIQLRRGTNPLEAWNDDLMVAELFLHYTKGQLWTKLSDGTMVMIGSQKFIEDAPEDGYTYGREDGEWVRVGATEVSDDRPENPVVGTLWYDTGSTAELYVWDGFSWVSVTGAGGGGAGAADNVVLDDADPTMRNVALAREINTEGDGFWRQIYTSDLVTENNQPMFAGRADDGIRNQKDANWYLLDLIEALTDCVISDTPPEDPKEGELWFDNTEDVMQLFLWHEDSDAWLPVAPPTTLEGRVTAGETTQQAIIDQIQQSLDDQAKIVAKVEELTITKGAVARYVVKDTTISGVASRNGELYVSSPTAADVQYLSFAPFDSNGQTTKPCNPDDIVEFVEAAGGRNAGDVTRYKVISGDYNALTVEYLSGTNDFEVGEAEEVYIYPQNSDLATIEYVDAQDDLLRTAISGNAIAISSKADKSYVDAQDDALGGRIDGRVAKQGDNILTDEWRIKQQNASGNNNNLIVAKDGELNLYHVKYPTSNEHAANMKYVDDEIAKIVIPEIPEIPEATEALQPVLWTFMGTSTNAEDLNDGEFTFRYEGDQGSEGFFKIYTALRDASGQLIASPTTFQHNMQDKYLISIQGAEGGNNIHMKSKTFYFGVGTSPNQYHRFEARFWRVATGCSTGQKYILNIPGILPTFSKPSDIGAFALPDEPPCGDIPPEADA